MNRFTEHSQDEGVITTELTIFWERCYIVVARHASQETRHVTAAVVWRHHESHKAHVTCSLHTVIWRHLRMRYIATDHSPKRRKHFRSVVAWRMRCNVPTGLPSSNALSKSVTICIINKRMSSLQWSEYRGPLEPCYRVLGSSTRHREFSV
jgi:hypothetical protein